MNHRVVVRRERTYPFKAHWGCICGAEFNASYMGRPLYEEFGKHLREVNDEVAKEKEADRSGS